MTDYVRLVSRLRMKRGRGDRGEFVMIAYETGAVTPGAA
jgi:hypothetical protein